MTNKQQKQFNLLLQKLMRQRKTTNSWWNRRATKREQKISLNAIRKLWHKVAASGTEI